MIESYLRANNMFVDYNEVGKFQVFFFGSDFLFESHSFLCELQPQEEKKYSSYLNLDLSEVEPCMSGPKR